MALILIFIYQKIMSDRSYSWGERRQFYAGQRFKKLQEAFKGIKTIKIFNEEKFFFDKYFNTQIWQCLLESFASEQAARMLAMDNATENAKEMISDLKLQFNKARQTAITTEMLEIVGGAEALSN